MQQGAQVEWPQPSANVVVHRLKGFVARLHNADPVIDPRIINEVHDLLAANNYDIVHGHSFGSILALAGLRAARQLGMPTLITKHSMVLTLTRLSFVNRILLQGELRVAKKWADGVIAVSQGAAQELAALDLPTYNIPSGVDCERWRPDPEARKRIRDLLGYQEDDIVVGYLARLIPSKGAMSLLNIAARIVRLWPNVRFLIIGEGPMRSQLEHEVEELRLQTAVTLLGSRPWMETPYYLNAMDIFAFPSYREAFGLALVEAMACGIAPVARVNVGSREVIADGQNGYLIDSDEELLQKVLELAQDADLRKRIGVNARRSVQDKYSWRVIAGRIAEVYEEVIRRRLEG